MKATFSSLLPFLFWFGQLSAATEEKIHQLSEIDTKCKQLSTRIFNCEKVECKYIDTVDGVSNHWSITINGQQKKMCKISVVLDNSDVTKTNVFMISKLERNNLAAYFRELFKKKQSSIVKEQACCSENKATKKFCYVTVNGSRVLDVLDDRPYFGCDGSKLFEVEQQVVGKNGAGSSNLSNNPPPPPPFDSGAPQAPRSEPSGAPDMGLPPDLPQQTTTPSTPNGNKMPNGSSPTLPPSSSMPPASNPPPRTEGLPPPSP